MIVTEPLVLRPRIVLNTQARAEEEELFKRIIILVSELVELREQNRILTEQVKSLVQEFSERIEKVSDSLRDIGDRMHEIKKDVLESNEL